MPQRIQLSRAAGWRMPPNAVKIDRSTRWGNPFRIGLSVDVIQAKKWGWWPLALPLRMAHDQAHAVRLFAAAIALDEAIHGLVKEHLRGKDLGCWCELGTPCHGDPLLEIANR